MSDWDEEIEAEANGVKLERTYSPANGRGTWGGSDHQYEPRTQAPAFPSVRSGRGRARGRGRDRPARIGQESNWRAPNDMVENEGFHADNNRRNPGRGRGGFGPRTERDNQPRDNQEFETNGFRDDASSDWTTFEMEVFNDRVGKLIGKGGQTIKEIQSTTGARVKILKEKASFRGTPIEICGPSAAVEKAKEMVEDINTPSAALYRNQGETTEQEVKKPIVDWAMVVEESANYTRMKWSNARPIKKTFYEELDHIRNLHPADVAEIRKSKNSITVQDMSDGGDDNNVPNPVLTFEDAFHNYPEILDTIYNANFTEPSPIQCQSWPVILSGLDMIGIAQTGTGKTLAFLLPAFIHIHGQKIPKEERKGPSCLVLSPTRELALQIEQEVRKFKYKGIKSVCIYGGGDRRQQINEVKKGVEIVIGTPGRLNDLLMNGILTVSDVTYLVLDEADRMLDMGFEPEIKKIILDIRPDRQTIMTSATWPPDVQRLADQYLKDPIKVNVGSLDLQACHTVTQLVEMCDASEKKEMVVDFINSMGPTDKLLIFVGKKVHVDDMGSDFALHGVGTDIGVQTIHGDRCQEDREQALEDFRLGDVRVLIATDVASRGLDIKDVTHVINYDFPRHIEEYVHRIGRTGRAGRSGTALSFITREDWAHAQKLIDIMTEANQEIPDELIDMAQRYETYRQKLAQERNEYRGGGGRGRGRGGRGGGCFKCGETGHRARDCRGGDPMGRGFRPESVTAKSRDRNRRNGWGASDECW